MKSYEKKLLFNKKVKEGKDFDISDFEIEMIGAYQKNIKYDFKSLQREVKELTKDNERLNKLLNKRLVPNEPKVKIVLDKPKDIKYLDRSCSVKYLYRIIKFIEDNPKSRITNIKDFCNIRNSEIINEALYFLVKYKLINELKEKGVSFYDRK